VASGSAVASGGPALRDLPLHYRLMVSNAGLIPATAVRLTDPLPETTELLDLQADRGTATLVERDVIFEPGDLDPGAAATLELTLRPLATGGLAARVWYVAGRIASHRPANSARAAPTSAAVTTTGVRVVTGCGPGSDSGAASATAAASGSHGLSFFRLARNDTMS